MQDHIDGIRELLGRMRKRKREKARRENYLLPEDWPRGWQDLMRRSEELEKGLSDEEWEELERWEKELDT